MAEFPSCGAMIPSSTVIASESGGFLPLFLTGADETISGGVSQVITMAGQAGDFIPDGLSSDGSFMICIESAAAIQVQLFNGDAFTITTAQATAYLGQWYPAKLLKVYKTGTTGTFSTGR